MNLEKLKSKELKVIADKELRKYLLLNTQHKGEYYFCPIKQKWFHESKMHVAHFIDRGIMITRYDLTNCHLISEASNSYDAQIVVKGYKSKHHKEYEEFLIERYGENTVQDLKNKSTILDVFTKDDYINVINFLKGNE